MYAHQKKIERLSHPSSQKAGGASEEKGGDGKKWGIRSYIHYRSIYQPVCHDLCPCLYVKV